MLAHQIILHNTLVLQYNCMVLERMQNDVRAVDQFIGHVHFMIQKSGYTAASECAMQEDYMGQAVISNHSHPLGTVTTSHHFCTLPLMPTTAAERIVTPHFPIDVDLT
jgi:hypothetical protein